MGKNVYGINCKETKEMIAVNIRMVNALRGRR